jgi:hypothetical protein
VCTDDSCDPAADGGAGACVNAVNDANCDDGLFCNGAETCDPVLDCQLGTPPSCDDGVACTDDSCDPFAAGGAGACVNAINDVFCDDGLYCDGVETCDAVNDCQAGTSPCTDPSFPVCDESNNICVECLVDADCDDGLFCNGVETCVGTVCQAGTDPCEDNVGCTVDVCDEVADTCSNTPDDTNCDDGVFCNGAETCDPVSDCQLGTDPCEDNVVCTVDVCDEVADTCSNTPDDAFCDDGLFCNGAEFCDPVSDCQPGTDPCEDNVGCTVDICDDLADTCTNTADDTICDDGLFCNGAETCDAVLDCQPGFDPCDDGVGCTDDICDEVGDACGHQPNDTLCDDGLFCNGAETCDAVLDCQPGTDPCEDNVGCTVDVCDEALNTCSNTTDNTLCDDGLFCNGSETCDPALDCQPGDAPCTGNSPGCDESTDQCYRCFCPDASSCLAPECDDTVACTDDFCQFLFSAWQCVNVANNTNCDDGLACNGLETCSRTQGCQAGVNVCPTPEEPDLPACIETVDGPVCVECTVPEDCENGIFCDGIEQCVDNVCQPGPNPCDDGVDCTVDVCDEDGAFCLNNLDDTLCDDGEFCNGEETCHRTLDCQPGTPPCTDPNLPICSENNDVCVECLTNLHCDDGLFCNGQETCVLNSCEPGSSPCGDGIDCTVDSCNETTDACTNAPTDLLCDDTIACTVNICDPNDPDADANGCIFTPDDVLCDDGLACTGDACDPGDAVADADGCVLTPNDSVCDDSIACTVNSCDPASPSADADGCTFVPDDTRCDDAVFCNGAEWCDAALDCQPGSDPCTDPLRPLCDETNDLCAECLADVDCDDGEFCNGAETCTGGECLASTNPCNDGVSCTIDSCNESSDTCTNLPENLLCDDGLFCNGPETCDPVLDCQPGVEPCDDGVECTVDNCDENSDVCGTHFADDAFCDDGLFCNGAETCDAILDCQSGIAPCSDPEQPVCDDDLDRCVGCLDTADCDDGLFCNGAETCVDNVCQLGMPPCDDLVECTFDECDDVADTCTNTPQDAFCDDGLFCNGAETCDPVEDCQLGVEPCDDGNPCSADICDEGAETCSYEEYAYGNVDQNTTPEGEDVINLFDVFCILEGLQGDFSRCSFEQDDIHPCGGNNQINLQDVFAVLDAMLGLDPCCSNGIGACCTGTSPCFAVESDVAAECTNLGGTYFGDGTNCFTDSDFDGLLDVHETNTGVFEPPCSAGTDPNDPDTDGDGIPDGLETFATEDLDLPAMGSNPLRADIFVELDWTVFQTTSHRPSPAAMAAVVDAFAAAPILNADGSTGIAVHVDYGQGGAYTGGNLIPGGWSNITFESGFNGFKSSYFNADRRGIFHYGIFTHRYNSNTNNSSGVAEFLEDDFMVTLQNTVTNDLHQAGTLMRMIGHNMGLRAGGFENREYKPNYNSVMNARYQFDGVDDDCDAVGDGQLGFSDGSLITLNEQDLNEFEGICGNRAINWNGGGISSSVIRNINCPAGVSFACGGGGDVCGDSLCIFIMEDFDDWANIVINTLNPTDGHGEIVFGGRVPE